MDNLSMVKDLIESQLKGSEVHVNDLTGTKDHLGLMVVSDEFEGKTRLEQHQMVMDILREALKEQVHAVQIKTLTRDKYARHNP